MPAGPWIRRGRQRGYTRAISESGTVLVVDDDAAIRLLCRVNLELDGYRALEAATPEAARATLAAEHVDVVLLDVHLGTADGLELLDELRRERPDLGTVLMTGSAELVGNTSAHEVLAKPFELEAFQGAVARAAASARRSV